MLVNDHEFICYMLMVVKWNIGSWERDFVTLTQKRKEKKKTTYINTHKHKPTRSMVMPMVHQFPAQHMTWDWYRSAKSSKWAYCRKWPIRSAGSIFFVWSSHSRLPSRATWFRGQDWRNSRTRRRWLLDFGVFSFPFPIGRDSRNIVWGLYYRQCRQYHHRKFGLGNQIHCCSRRDGKLFRDCFRFREVRRRRRHCCCFAIPRQRYHQDLGPVCLSLKLKTRRVQLQRRWTRISSWAHLIDNRTSSMTLTLERIHTWKRVVIKHFRRSKFIFCF